MGKNRIMRALIVEDKPADTQLLQLALARSGFALELSFVKEGVEALSFLRQEDSFASALRPDIILLDWGLLGMSGLEVLSAIKADKELSAIPVVIISDSALNKDVLAAYQGGVAGYFLKPADLDQLVATI
ncbi:MAG: response regulator, partial [Gallionellaceae bacterium]|nr:response regulator [Gallionellaceae bacterium]